MDFKTLAMIEHSARQERINTEIHPADSMYTGGKGWYYETGSSGLRKILSGLALSPIEQVRSVLDLGCGYGRVARFIRAAFPDAILTFSDIDKSAVEFCAATFNGIGVYSDPNPDTLRFGQKFDVIWIGSLFTHLSAERTMQWLRRLTTFLNLDGLLIASFHGTWSVKMHETYPMIDGSGWKTILEGYEATGWGFSAYQDQPEWGISVGRPWKVVEMASNLPGCRVLSYIERGWADNHDILTVAKTDRGERWSPNAETWV